MVTILKYVLWWTNFCYLSNDAICLLKPVDRELTLPRVITLPHFPLYRYYTITRNFVTCITGYT